jgi:tetratricopeptide (TPR) repeat protein
MNEALALESEAQACLARHDLEEARSRYARICEIRPQHPDSWLMLGALEGEVGNADAALAAIRKAVELDQDFAEAHLALSHLLNTLGNPEAALQAVDKAVAIDPDYGEALLFQGALLGQLRRYPEAVTVCRRAVEQMPDSADALANLGNALQQLGQMAEAQSVYRRALRLQPDRVELLSGLGNVLAAVGKADEAIEILQRAKAARVDFPDVYTGLGVAWLAKRDFAEALSNFQRRLLLTPGVALGKVHEGLALRGLNRTQEADNSFTEALASGDRTTLPLAYNMLGTVRAEDGKPEEALQCYRKALELAPGYLAALDNSGRALEALGRFEEALAVYQRAAEVMPSSADLAANQASVLQRMDDYQNAYRLIEPYLDRDKVTARVAEVFSRLCGKLNRCEEAIALLEDLLGREPESKDRRPLSFALGQLYDRSGEYAKAFHCFHRANELKVGHYDREGFSRYIDAMLATFSKGLFELLPRSANVSDKPVFIVGMPRSGTSLVEQILASHPEVFGGGELRNIFDLVAELPVKLGGVPYPACMPSLTQTVVDALASEYLDAVNALAPDSLRVTDKMPHNFLHLGLIKVLLPAARIVHCSRDPLDTCLSIYSQDFTGYHPYAYNLTDLGTHFRGYRRLMHHWQNTLGLPILEVRYEDLVADQEAVIRKLVAFCDLEWDDRCLRFYEAERTTRTASFDQVRQPIYQASVNRWRHYDAWLGELKHAIGDDVIQ